MRNDSTFYKQVSGKSMMTSENDTSTRNVSDKSKSPLHESNRTKKTPPPRPSLACFRSDNHAEHVALGVWEDIFEQVLLFGCGLGSSLCYIATLSALVYFTLNYGPDSYVDLNLAVYLPLLPISIAQARWDDYLDYKYQSRRTLLLRGLLAFGLSIWGTIGMALQTSQGLGVVVCNTTLQGIGGAILYGTLNQLASFLGHTDVERRRAKSTISAGVQASALAVLAVAIASGFASQDSERFALFMWINAIIEVVCTMMFLWLVLKQRRVVVSLTQRDSALNLSFRCKGSKLPIIFDEDFLDTTSLASDLSGAEECDDDLSDLESRKIKSEQVDITRKGPKVICGVVLDEEEEMSTMERVTKENKVQVYDEEHGEISAEPLDRDSLGENSDKVEEISVDSSQLSEEAESESVTEEKDKGTTKPSSDDYRQLTYMELWHGTKVCTCVLLVTLIPSFLVGSWFAYVNSRWVQLPQVLFYTRIAADFLGRLATMVLPPRGIRWVVYGSLLRLVPVVVFFFLDEGNDILYIVLVGLIAFLSGYLVTGCYQLAPKCIPEKLRSQNAAKQASFLTVAFSVAAVGGLSASFALKELVF